MVASEASVAGWFQSFQQRHSGLFAVLAVTAVLCAARGICFVVWWFLFAPAALYAFAGAVTCDGIPISDGTIAFEPVARPGVCARTARITEGRFELSKAHGVCKDVEYVVRVESFRKTGKKFPGPKPDEYAEEYVQFVADRFNRGSNHHVRMTRDVLREELKLEVQAK